MESCDEGHLLAAALLFVEHDAKVLLGRFQSEHFFLSIVEDEIGVGGINGGFSFCVEENIGSCTTLNAMNNNCCVFDRCKGTDCTGYFILVYLAEGSDFLFNFGTA